MTKTAAKSPAPRKTAAKKAPAPARKAPAKAAKAPAKAPAKKAAAKKPTPTKAAPKAPAAKTKPVPKAAAKPVAKPVLKPVAKPAPKPAARPAAKPTPKTPAPTPAPAPAAGNRFTERFGPATSTKTDPPKPPMEVMKSATKPDPKLANAWKTKAGRDLTEAELLAMPEAEYMRDKQIDFFRARLQAQKDDLLSNAGETTEHLREDTTIVPDPADRATIEEEHALELRTRDRERKLLKKISQSIARIEAGDYGFCDETGEPIGLGRLLARPTATLSLEAQQRRELKQKMFGD